MTATSGPGWIGPPPTPLQACAVFYGGLIGVMMVGLQPLMLGALHAEARITSVQLGHAGSAELLMMGASTVIAGIWLKPTGTRWIGLIAGLTLALIDWLTLQTSSETVTLVRAAAGVPSGLLIWITVCMMTRAPRPEWWTGVYLTLQGISMSGLAAFMSAFVIGRWGANGGFVTLAVAGVIAGLASLAGPRAYQPLPPTTTTAGLPTAKGAVSLLITFLFLAGIGGIWLYVEPLSVQGGYGADVTGLAITLSLVAQVVGSALATVLAGRLPWFQVLLGCALTDVALLAVFSSLPSAGVFLAAQVLFGFVWLFILPFLVPMTIYADPTRRSAMLLGGAQLLGSSLGPLLASTVISEHDALGTVGFAVGCMALAGVLVTGLRLDQARGMTRG